MANYNVDIEVALKGAKKIKDLENNIKNLNKELETLTAKQKQVGQGNPFNAAGVKKYASGVDEAVGAVERLIDKNEKAIKTTDQLMKKGEEAVRKREMFRQLFRDADTVRGNIAASQRQDLQARVGAGVSAGAFPLLFGGGPGMALGGAVGGAITGKTFGPAAIALQVLGGFFDELAAKAATLGQALNLATADVDAIVESLGIVGSPAQDVIKNLEELAGEQVALQEATRQLSFVVGDDGVEALTAFGDASTRLGNALTQITTQILAAIARFSGPVVTQALKALEFQADLSAARQSSDPRQRLLQGQLQNVNLAEDVLFGKKRADLEAEMVKLQREIRTEEEARLQAVLERTRIGSAEHVIAKNNLAIAKLDGDLTNQRVFNLERANIFQEARKKLMQDGADVKLIELERDGQLLELTNRRNDLLDAANKKANRLSEREQRAIDRRVEAVERELERTDKAFDRAGSQLDAIINKHKDKMAFEQEYSRLIEQGSTPAAAKQAVELKKQLLELERGYDKLLDIVDAQIVKTEASLQDLKNQKGVTTEYQEQSKALDELKKRRGELEDKKKGAEGAINEALAPKTDRENLEAYLTKLKAQLNDLMNPANQLIGLAETLGGAFSESFKGLVTGSMSAQEALANLFQRTADHFLDMAAQMIAAQLKMQLVNIGLSFFGGGGFTPVPGSAPQMTPNAVVTPTGFQGQFAGFAANGGPVTGGKSYIVGEQGPELFTPGVSGGITPNHALGGANVTVNVDASGSSVEGDAQQSKALGQALGAAVKAELIKQKMPGGLLA